MTILLCCMLILAGIGAAGAAEIHEAASAGNVARVEAAMANDPMSVAQSDAQGRTPFHIAVVRKDINVARALLTGSQCAYVERLLDSRTKEGAAARASGLLESAHELLVELVKDSPDSEQVNFAYGMACLSLDKFPHAELAFERVLTINPRSGRARAELARSFLAMGHGADARDHFEQALASKPPSLAGADIRRYLDEIEKSDKVWRVSGRIELGYFDDDNVNVGPDSATINIAPIVFGSQTITSLAVSESSRPLDTRGYYGAGSLLLSCDVGDKGGWLVAGEGAFYRNWMDDSAEHESVYYHAACGPRRVSGGALFQLPVYASRILSGGDPLVDIAGASAGYMRNSGRRGALHVRGTCAAELRNYDALDDRDSVYIAADGTVSSLFDTGSGSAWLGLTVFHDNADAAIYENTGVALKTGVGMELPWSVEAFGRLRYTVTRYAEREILALEKRRDTEIQTVVGIGKAVARGLDLEFTYQHTDNNSTFGLYEYSRHVTAIAASTSF